MFKEPSIVTHSPNLYHELSELPVDQNVAPFLPLGPLEYHSLYPSTFLALEATHLESWTQVLLIFLFWRIFTNSIHLPIKSSCSKILTLQLNYKKKSVLRQRNIRTTLHYTTAVYISTRVEDKASTSVGRGTNSWQIEHRWGPDISTRCCWSR